jgi:aryl-alcohol dehydrogenase-like predicted oxidoreductase
MNPPTLQMNIPLHGPLSREAFFALHSPAKGIVPLPRLAVGTARCGDAESEPRIGQAVQMLHKAWGDGFLLTDTAPLYGNAENVVGAALASRNGPEPVLATKCGVERDRTVVDFSRAFIRRNLERSRERFGGRPIDLLAAHEPESCPASQRQECIDTLAELIEEGQIRAAGLGGGGIDVQRPMMAGGVIGYVLTYNRISAASLQGVGDIVPLCRASGAKVLAGSPLMGGMLGNLLDSYLDNLQKGELLGGEDVFVRRARKISAIAEEAAMALPRLAIRFLLSMPQVDYVVAGTGNLQQWNDCFEAYQAGPLPVDLYQRIWHIAQEGAEPVWGG